MQSATHHEATLGSEVSIILYVSVEKEGLDERGIEEETECVERALIGVLNDHQDIILGEIKAVRGSTLNFFVLPFCSVRSF